ncbi:Pathogenesis-related protein Bet v I domain-containing protein [Forsythia ovata]|uniref:Pathogenesis-related protein Bet v I domain-containing protein n=1 Tax=Forsythia ovata TaxID=205694 RepID=A0ABD1PH09_9LAMI
MGVFKFFHELKTNASPKRMFKALITDNHDVLPKVTPSIKSIETIQGDGAHFKYLKNRVDFLDPENYVSKFTLVEGDALGDQIESIVYEVKFEDSKDGGCVVKIASEYHTKGDVVLKEEDINAGKDQAMGIYKACADYLIANPHGQRVFLSKSYKLRPKDVSKLYVPSSAQTRRNNTSSSYGRRVFLSKPYKLRPKDVSKLYVPSSAQTRHNT